jgi:hypothetical protein
MTVTCYVLRDSCYVIRGLSLSKATNHATRVIYLFLPKWLSRNPSFLFK